MNERSVEQATFVVPNNLPGQLTSFVGRRSELAQVAELLDGARLLTLTGAGGCGKTRVALQAAADALDRFPDGVWWVELARLEDDGLLAVTVIEALGLREAPGRAPLDTLIDHLRGRSLLLVLDNCEHLLAACAELVDALLRSCPALAILATSRTQLGVPGETAWRVPSMSLPQEPGREAVEVLGEYDAVRLFIDRTRQVRPDFAIGADNAAAVAQICHGLDGIPLAIELAAARVRMLTPEQIAGALDDRFHLLTGGSRTVLPRHQTLQASIEWSYDLLSEGERALFRRLSVFAGGWTLGACEQVCAGEGIERDAVLDLLTGLVDKSLVVTDDQAAEVRYSLLETVRQYAAALPAEADEAESVRDRHLAYYLGLAERSEHELLGAARDDPPAKRLRAEMPNLRGALEWAAVTDPGAALRLAGALVLFWLLNGRSQEGDLALATALEAAGEEPTPPLGRALWGRAALGLFGGAPDAARWAQQALEVGEACADIGVQARALDTIGHITIILDPAEGRAPLERSVALATQAGDWRATWRNEPIRGTTCRATPPRWSARRSPGIGRARCEPTHAASSRRRISTSNARCA